jgi:hypothetical protein
MKLQILIGLILTSVASAQHPRDFVPEDALAVASFMNGDAINATLKSINDQSGLPSVAPNALELTQFFEDPSAVDYSSEVLIIIAPTKLAEGQKPTGMFGPMPHLMVVCKAKSGQSLAITKTGGLITSTTVDGWFVGTGAESWSPNTSAKPASILADLPDAQVSATVDFASVWKQFGTIGQMLGGMAIGSLNSPGPDGVITPKRKKATAAASKGFKEFTKWCASVKTISVGLNFDKYTLIVDLNVEMKEWKNLNIDNKSLFEMSKLLSDNMAQYAMSGKLTRKLIDMDLDSLRDLAPDADNYPSFMTSQLKAMIDSIDDNVVSYALDTQHGLTLSSLSDVENQNQYLEDMFEVVGESAGMLLNEFSMELSLTDTPNTWDVKMLPSDNEETKVMNTIIPKGNQLHFSKYGKNRVMMGFGPQSWQPFGRSHSTPLSEVMSEHTETVDIDFAGTIDARSFLVGITEVVRIVDPKGTIPKIGTTPSARSSLLFGTTQDGTFIEIKLDLLGTATLFAEMN